MSQTSEPRSALAGDPRLCALLRRTQQTGHDLLSERSASTWGWRYCRTDCPALPDANALLDARISEDTAQRAELQSALQDAATLRVWPALDQPTEAIETLLRAFGFAARHQTVYVRALRQTGARATLTVRGAAPEPTQSPGQAAAAQNAPPESRRLQRSAAPESAAAESAALSGLRILPARAMRRAHSALAETWGAEEGVAGERRIALSALLDSTAIESIVAVDAARAPLGLATMLQTSEIAQIRDVFVTPAARRAGVASALVEWLTQAARRWRLHTLLAHADVNDAAAAALLKRTGFAPCGTIPMFERRGSLRPGAGG